MEREKSAEEYFARKDEAALSCGEILLEGTKLESEIALFLTSYFTKIPWHAPTKDYRALFETMSNMRFEQKKQLLKKVLEILAIPEAQRETILQTIAKVQLTRNTIAHGLQSHVPGQLHVEKKPLYSPTEKPFVVTKELARETADDSLTVRKALAALESRFI